MISIAREIRREAKVLGDVHIHSPISFTLTGEVKKCHDIFLELVKQQKDQATLQIRLRSALGIIIMTTVKAQGLGGVGGGSGVLVARRRDGGWSAPVAVGGMSASFGSAGGAKLTDSMILLMDPAEVQNFAGVGVVLTQGLTAGVALGNQTAGMTSSQQIGTKSASMSVKASVGGKAMGKSAQTSQAKMSKLKSSTLGSNGGTSFSSVSGAAGFEASYTYSRTIGMHAGATSFTEFLTIQHAINCIYYGRRVKVRALLNGEVPQPEKFRYFYQSLEQLSGVTPSPCYPKGGLFPLRAGELLEEPKEPSSPLSSSVSNNPLQQAVIIQEVVQGRVISPPTSVAVQEGTEEPQAPQAPQAPQQGAAQEVPKKASSSWLGSMFGKKEEIVYEQNRQIVVEWDMSNPNTAKRLHPTYSLTVHGSNGAHTRAGLRFKVFRALFHSLGKLPFEDPSPFPPTHSKSGFGMKLTQKQLDARIRMLLVWLSELEASSDLLNKKQRKKYEKFLYDGDAKY